MSIPNKDTLSCHASDIAAMLWGSERLLEEGNLIDADGKQTRDYGASLAVIRAARQLLDKLADDIDALPKG